MKILGISAFYHDSSASLIDDGHILSAVQEERFTRKKHDKSFPLNSIEYCLSSNNLKLTDIDAISFYENPQIKFNRLLHTYLRYAPNGMNSFSAAMKEWLPIKLFMKKNINKNLSKFYGIPYKHIPKIYFMKHHFSHAASAFYASPYKKSSILCIDGVGEWTTTSIWEGNDNIVKFIKHIKFPHSLGLLYSAFTYFLGFKVNSGEYKVMGLAPYGEGKYKNLILNNLIDLKEDGSFHLNMDFFDFHVGKSMINNNFCKLFNAYIRKENEDITAFHMDVASSLQSVINDIVIKIAKNIKKENNSDNLCLAGGVALNCVANGKLSDQKIFKNIWVQPASGDAGGSLGASLGLYYQGFNNKRIYYKKNIMKGSYLGPEFSDGDMEEFFEKYEINFEKLSEKILLKKVANLLSKSFVIGWFQGRMEYGPRALGNRSILGDPRDAKLQNIMNMKIKKRESFRPFAPAIMEDHVDVFYNKTQSSPFMNFVTKLKDEHRINLKDTEKNLFGIDLLNIKNSTVPAVTHVDHSARIQTVNKENNKKFYNLLSEFNNITQIPILINTSFNVRGEPIVCTPEDAYRCFMTSDMDYLAINNFLLYKKNQNPIVKNTYFHKLFESD